MPGLRKEIWLYERVEADGTVGKHLYVVLSNEHPTGLGGVNRAEFVEDVYTKDRNFRRIEQGLAFDNMRNNFYSYVNYSEDAIHQEWLRPVFSCKKFPFKGKENFLWECFRKQSSALYRRRRN